MNIKIITKMRQRMTDLESKANELKSQIVEISSFNDVKNKLEQESLQSELEDTLTRLHNISAANSKFIRCE